MYVYLRAHPYPVVATDFVNKEIANSLWVVDKKGVGENENRKLRLVVH